MNVQLNHLLIVFFKIVLISYNNTTKNIILLLTLTLFDCIIRRIYIPEKQNL